MKDKRTTTSAVEILHHLYFKNDPEMMQMLEAERIKGDIAQRVYDLREAASLTQEQLAEKVGSTVKVIDDLEMTDYEDSSIGDAVLMLQRIAQAVGKQQEERKMNSPIRLRSDSQILGKEAEESLRGALPWGWIADPPEEDVGVDFSVVVDEDSDISGRQFQVQVKGSRHLKIQHRYVSRKIKVNTIRLWFLCPLPTLIVVCDMGKNTGYFEWHYKFYKLLDGIKGDKKRVNIEIPIKNKLDLDTKDNPGWDKIRDDLRLYYSKLAGGLAQGRNAQSVLPTIHDLSAAARQLNSIDHQPVPMDKRTDQQEGLLALMEIMQYRLVVTSLSNLQGSLVPNSEGERRLNKWIRDFEDRIEEVFPTFSTLTDWEKVPPDFELAYHKHLIHAQRPEMIEAILEMVMLLAPGRFNAPSSELKNIIIE